MKIRKYIVGILLPLIIIFICVGCDDKNKDNISYSDETEFDTFTFDTDNNCLALGNHSFIYNVNSKCFESQNRSLYFAKFGKVDVLSNVDRCEAPKAYSYIAVVPHYGYILYLPEEETNAFARLRVVSYVENDKDGIVGAKVKYQYPWNPDKESEVPTIFIDITNPSIHDDPDAPDYPDTPVDPEEPVSDFDTYWNGSSWYFEGEMSCDGYGVQNFTITFNDIYQKKYISNLSSKYWLVTSLEWEDYKWVNGSRQITLRGYDDGGHTSFDFDVSKQNEALCEYHHWDTQGNFCKANFIGKRIY